MNPLPEFLEPVSEFEMWRDYREKRNRRAFYFLAVLLILLIVASALPSTTGPVFGTGDNSSQTNPNGSDEQVIIAGQDGQDGEDGRDGANGRPGQDGLDGQDGAPGAPGSSGPAGPPGAPGSGGGSNTTPSPSPSVGIGQGVIRVGTCDDAIAASLRSRIIAGVFYFRSILLSGIHSDCDGKNIDIYLLDADGVELASALGGEVDGSIFSLQHDAFKITSGFSRVAVNVLASDLDSIALEIAD